MKAWDSLRRIFGAKNDAPHTLRNTANGMAWVRLGKDKWGAHQLDGSAVRCVSVDAQGFWLIEPTLKLRVQSFARAIDGQLAWPGEVAEVIHVHDKWLEPWKNLGDDASDETLWMRPAPAPEILALPVREMTK